MGGEKPGLRLRTEAAEVARATRARWVERGSYLQCQPGLTQLWSHRVPLVLYRFVPDGPYRVGARFSGRHGWLRIREPGAAGWLR